MLKRKQASVYKYNQWLISMMTILNLQLSGNVFVRVVDVGVGVKSASCIYSSTMILDSLIAVDSEV